MGVFLLAIGATLQAGAGIMPALLMAVLGALSLLVIRSHARRLEESRISFGHNEDYIEGIARLSSDIHLLLDIEEGRFLYLSEAVSETLGYPQETFLSGGLEHLLTLVHPEDVHLVQAHFQRLESTRRPPPYTLSNEPMEELSFRIRDNHGAWRWFRCRRLVLKREIDGQPGTLLAVLRDVSEQWALDAAIVQAQKLGTTSTLIRGTVHDLNNALMAIHGFTEILLAGPEATGPLRQDLAAILSAADRATGLCGKLAVYGGPGRIRIGRISLNGLIMDSLSHL